MSKKQNARIVLQWITFVAAVGFQIGLAYGQNSGASTPSHPWLNKPSARLVDKLKHWHLTFEPGTQIDAPDKGEFKSFANQITMATAHLTNDQRNSVIAKLTPVAERTRYLPVIGPRDDPKDRVVTNEMMGVIGSPEVMKFIDAKHLADPRLDVRKNLAVVLVQEFDAALRVPHKKEHIWTIHWRVDRDEPSYYVGYAAWGLFTKSDGTLKPFYLAAGKAAADFTSPSYFYVLAVGDLDGDGIDELITREMIFEAEEDHLQILSWEKGAPVLIQDIP
jgi:hypothetical protein